MIPVRGEYRPLDEAPSVQTVSAAWRCSIERLEPNGDALLCCGALVHGGEKWAFYFREGSLAPCPRCTPKRTDIPGIRLGAAVFQGPAHTDRELCCRYATIEECNQAWTTWLEANDLSDHKAEREAQLVKQAAALEAIERWAVAYGRAGA